MLCPCRGLDPLLWRGGGLRLVLRTRCSGGVRCELEGVGPWAAFHLFHLLGKDLRLATDGGELQVECLGQFPQCALYTYQLVGSVCRQGQVQF